MERINRANPAALLKSYQDVDHIEDHNKHDPLGHDDRMQQLKQEEYMLYKIEEQR
jgi:hypothetical protein